MTSCIGFCIVNCSASWVRGFNIQRGLQLHKYKHLFQHLLVYVNVGWKQEFVHNLKNLTLMLMCSFFWLFRLPGVGIHVPSPATAAVQPAQQASAAQAAPQPAQTASMQPQATPQHQQLFMNQQQASAFLSPQSNQQVGILVEQEWNHVLVTLRKSHSGMLMDECNRVFHFRHYSQIFKSRKQYHSQYIRNFLEHSHAWFSTTSKIRPITG